MNRHKLRNIVWGIVLLLIAVAAVMYQMNVPGLAILHGITLWQGILAIVLLYALIDGLTHVSYAGILFPLAFLGMVFKSELHIEALVPWTLLLAAVLGTIALNMIFGHRHSRHWGKDYKTKCASHDHHHHGMNNVIEETVENDYVRENIAFCGATKYIHSENFTGADLDCRFCGAEFYFDKVVIPTGEAEIIINNRYAGLELHIPRNWEIKNMVNNFCAAVDGDTRAEGEAVATVTLKGYNRFGGIDIKRI